MILVDTSVWADHIRRSDADLTLLLGSGEVLTHRFVIEELACGHLPRRSQFIANLHALPRAPIASHMELLDLIAGSKLYGTGLGCVDMHIAASAMLAKAKIWSRDKALSREAVRLGISVNS